MSVEWPQDLISLIALTRDPAVPVSSVSTHKETGRHNTFPAELWAWDCYLWLSCGWQHFPTPQWESICEYKTFAA